MTEQHLNTQARPERTGLLRRFLLLSACFAVFGILWAIGMPLMSAPDEPSHAVRAVAVAHGDWTGHEYAAEPWQVEVNVPLWASHSYNLACFAFQPDVTAACQSSVSGDPNRITPIPTTAGINSPAYYAIVGLPSLFLTGDIALYAMRAMSAVVCAALLAIMFTSLHQLPSNRWALTAAAVSITPMTLFLAGSLNPNGVEVAAAGALAATLIVTLRTTATQSQLWKRGVLIVVTAGLLASTRNIALLWILVAVCGALLLAKTQVISALVRRPVTWAAAVAGILVMALSLAWYLKPPIPSDAPQYVGSDTSAIATFTTMIAQFFDFARDWFGNFGWLDRPAPAVAVAIWTTLSMIIIVGALFAAKRPRWAVILGVAALVLVPAVAQTAIVAELGFIWQGRYTLALYTCVLIFAGVALEDRWPDALRTEIGVKLLRVVAVGLGVGHFVSYLWALKRYVVGADASWLSMLKSPDWQPPLGWITLTIILIVTLTIVGGYIWRTTRQVSREAATLQLPRN